MLRQWFVDGGLTGAPPGAAGRGGGGGGGAEGTGVAPGDEGEEASEGWGGSGPSGSHSATTRTLSMLFSTKKALRAVSAGAPLAAFCLHSTVVLSLPLLSFTWTRSQRHAVAALGWWHRQLVSPPLTCCRCAPCAWLLLASLLGAGGAG